MFLNKLEIDKQSTVSELVQKDYRTADVFRKFEIEYCCGGRWPLETVCMMKGLEVNDLIRQLEDATRTVQIPNIIAFQGWNLDFLIDYIINVHHNYLRKALPETEKLLQEFSEKHASKFVYLPELISHYDKLSKKIMASMEREEEIIFPYIRQITHAWADKESYAALLVRTLRKPLEEMMHKENETIPDTIRSVRELTMSYTPPEKACVSHHVVFSKLKEIDEDLMQHIYLEKSVLFPRAVEIERELLQ